ncbi:uncharacterized protein LOC135473788 [Liolophura sinensis]|uniref:uncharacterized protein LOC135473788 n=1 Tax=Liolophura sinensis TaxID=3198878 RepID=UPI003158FEC3
MRPSQVIIISAAILWILCLVNYGESVRTNDEMVEEDIKKTLEEHYTDHATRRKKRFVQTLIPIVAKVIGGQMSTGVTGILKGQLGKNITTNLITKIAGKLTDEIINKNHKDDIDKELAEYFASFNEKSDKKAAELKTSIKTVIDELSKKNANMLEGGAKINIVPQKGMQLGDLFSPPGVEIDTQYTNIRSEPDSQAGDSYSFTSGVGNALLNGCYGPSLSASDPCYAAKKLLPKCQTMLDAANFIGVGFDGRGDYSSSSRRKSVIQRVCNRGGSYDGKSVPDSMTVHGVYDTNVRTMAFSSVSQYQSYLEKKAAVAQSSYMFAEAVVKAYGRGSVGFLGLAGGGGGFSSNFQASGSSSSSSSSSSHSISQQDKFRQVFMSSLEVDVIRYEVFLDDVTFNDLNMDFLHDFVFLPQSYFAPGAPQKFQDFILRWGTHYVKSAEFGGQLKLVKTKEGVKEESIEKFAEKAQSDYKAMFSTYMAASAQFKSRSLFHKAEGGVETEVSVGHGNTGAQSDETQGSEQSVSQQKYSNEVLMVEGGEQGIAAVVSEMYTTGFKHELVQWLDSIPRYPKPFDFQMAPITDLCNINFKQLFPNASMDFGCFGEETMLTESGTGRKYYVWKTEEWDELNNETYVKEHKRYCDYENAQGLEDALRRRCNALRTAVAVYLEEGPIPSTDIHLRPGKAGCETNRLAFVDSLADLRKPSWDRMTDGSTFRVVFDMAEDIPGVVGRAQSLLLFYRTSTRQWYVQNGEEFTHLYDGFGNGGSNSLNNKKISVRGLVLKYNSVTGLLSLDSTEFEASKAVIPHLSVALKGAIVGRVEYVSMLQQIQQHKNEFGVGTSPCNVVWSNAHRFNPAIVGGRCVSFTAVCMGDIFVVFSAIPRDKNTWYYVQISPDGVAIYKGHKVMKFIDDSSARSLGDPRLFESYFVCVEEALDGSKTTITYGKTPDNRERGHVYAVFEDTDDPLHVRFYAFGNGERELNVMDAHVLRTSATGEHICVGGTVMFEGKCVEDCHPECNGCHRPDLDTACRACKHYQLDNRCVADCPDTHKPDKDDQTCICAFVEDGQCASSCSVDRVAIPDAVESGICACRYYLEGAPDECLANCPSSSYGQALPNGQTVCKRCHKSCVAQPEALATCSGPAVEDCVHCIKTSTNVCLSCGPGRYVQEVSSPVCLRCPVGYQCPGDGRRYQCSMQANEKNNLARTACVSCPSGQYSTTPASGICHTCAAGWTRPAKSSRCQRCPKNKAGPNCKLTCKCVYGECMQADGKCKCYRGFSGQDCSVPSEGAIRLVDGRLSSLYVDSIAHAKLEPVPASEVVNKTIGDIVKDDNVVKTVKANVYKSVINPPVLKSSDDSGSAPVLLSGTSGTLATGTLNTKLALPRKKRALLTKMTPEQILKPSLSVAKHVATDKAVVGNVAGLTLAFPTNPVLDVSGKIRGRVEIFMNGRWGTVCDKGWTQKNTDVVCRQMGYKHGSAKTGAYFGKGVGQITVTRALCHGNETWFKSCPRAKWWFFSACRHSNDVGVICW